MIKEKSPSATIMVNHLARVEGHANLVVDVSNGAIQQCDLQIVEAPRYIEALLRGVAYHRAPRLASRICGICAVTHATASIRAVEDALDIHPSRQTADLRRLMLCAEMLDSHLLHTNMLVAPDLLGAGSILPLLAEHPEVVRRALRLKQAAGDICAVVAGRHTHPVTMVPGGFSHLPAEADLRNLQQSLQALAPDIDALVDLFAGLDFPDFERETIYLALKQQDAYACGDGFIASSNGDWWPIKRYQEVVSEFQIGHSTAKHAHHRRQPYMVGALARFNLNGDQLHPEARAAARRLGLDRVCHNPFMITKAQVVEIVHFYQESLRLLQGLLESGVQAEGIVPPGRLTGEGVGACEAPRGTLYHHYAVRQGTITRANCVIPTAQNLANIEEDMRGLTAHTWGQPREQLVMQLEMLVRAYDPCISCATHMVEVRFE